MSKTYTDMFTKYAADFVSIALKQLKPGSRSSGTFNIKRHVHMRLLALFYFSPQ